MNRDELPTTSVPRRRLRRFVELVVVAAVALTGSLVTSVETAPPAAAADPILCTLQNPCPEDTQLYPPPPLMWLETSGYGGTPAQNASLRTYENIAVQTVLDLHGLSASEENAVRTWGRDEVLAQLYIQLITAIQTPADQRTADQQNVADWAAEQARIRNADAATQAAREYVKWAGLGRGNFDALMASNPTEAQILGFLSGQVLNYDAPTGATEGWCAYRSPTPYESEYQGFNNPVCIGPFIGFVLPPTPSYDQFVKWGAAKAHYLLFSNGLYAERAARLGSALGVAIPLSVVISSASTYVAAARIATGSAQLVQSLQGLARFAGVTLQATSFSAAVASLVVASVALALTIIAAIVTAILVGIDVTNAANLPGKLASLVATARSTVPDPTTLLDSTDTATSFASIFVAATTPAPKLESCDNTRSFPGFLEITIIGTDQTSLSPNFACLNPTPIPAAADTDPLWSLTERTSGAKTTVSSLSLQTAAGVTTTRMNRSWFITQANGSTSQSLRLAYQDWNGDTQNAWVIADSVGYSFLTYQPPTDSSETVDINTCVAEETCGISQTLEVTGADGKQYTASIRPYLAPIGTPTVTNLLQGSPVAFDANGFAPGGAVAPVSYSWKITPASCFAFVCPTLATLTGATPTFSFDQGGTYELEVTATDSTGLGAVTTFRFTVAYAPPTVTFLPTCTGTPTTSCNAFTSSPGASVAVRGTIGYVGSSDNLKVDIEWGDGTVDSVQANPSGFRFPQNSPIALTPVAGQRAYTLVAAHTYGAPGTYLGSVRVTNRIGVSADGPSMTLPFTMTVTGAQTITFNPPSGTSYGNVFGISATGGASGRPVTFAATGVCSLSGQTGGAGTGSATVTMTGAGQCTLTASQAGAGVYRAAPDVVRRITSLLAPLTITASSPTVVYGQMLPAITPSYDGFRLNDTAGVLTTPPTCSVTSPGAAAGTYATGCSGAAGPNYSFGYVSGVLTIERAPLTVIAGDATMTSGEAVPALGASFDGFVGNDGPGVVSGVACVARDAQNEPVTSATLQGSYPITCSGGVAANYLLSYVAGTLTVLPAPPPVFEVAFVAGSGGDGPPKDRPVIARLRGQGHLVRVIDDDSLTSGGVAGFDVVVVSSSVVLDKVGTKLTEVSVPVVSWEGLLSDELRLAASGGETSTVQSQVVMVDGLHPVAAGLTGTFPIQSGSTRFNQASGVAPGVVVVARTPGGASSVLAADAGAVLTSGVAPARRVVLSWNYDAPPLANGSGWSIFDAAITWAAR